jgi:L-ascorbate metabolism protein UlaG (beta-lactamase superfamily)
MLPPGYTPVAARSAAQRYPRQLARSIFGAKLSGPLALDPEVLATLRASQFGAAWLGHATVLLRLGGESGLWVLTDPVFSRRVGLRVGPVTLGVPRITPPFDPALLPRPDLILLSHAHFDHLDRPSLKALAHPKTHVITAEGTRRLVPRGFGAVLELPWDAQHEVEDHGLRLHAVKPAHWGARTIIDKSRGYASYVVRHDAGSLLYAGDTAQTDAFAGLGPVDLSIFGIGAYDPWIHAHANPEQVWAMHHQTRASHLLPVHHSTFVLSDEPLDEPMRRLLAIAGDQQSRVICRDLGSIWTRERDGVITPE